MKQPFLRVVLLVVLAGFSGWALGQQNSDTETPIGPRWWPSEWGPADQRGAANRITPDKVLEASKLIKQGKMYSLAAR